MKNKFLLVFLVFLYDLNCFDLQNPLDLDQILLDLDQDLLDLDQPNVCLPSERGDFSIEKVYTDAFSFLKENKTAILISLAAIVILLPRPANAVIFVKKKAAKAAKKTTSSVVEEVVKGLNPSQLQSMVDSSVKKSVKKGFKKAIITPSQLQDIIDGSIKKAISDLVTNPVIEKLSLLANRNSSTLLNSPTLLNYSSEIASKSRSNIIKTIKNNSRSFPVKQSAKLIRNTNQWKKPISSESLQIYNEIWGLLFTGIFANSVLIQPLSKLAIKKMQKKQAHAYLVKDEIVQLNPNLALLTNVKHNFDINSFSDIDAINYLLDLKGGFFSEKEIQDFKKNRKSIYLRFLLVSSQVKETIRLYLKHKFHNELKYAFKVTIAMLAIIYFREEVLPNVVNYIKLLIPLKIRENNNVLFIYHLTMFVVELYIFIRLSYISFSYFSIAIKEIIKLRRLRSLSKIDDPVLKLNGGERHFYDAYLIEKRNFKPLKEGGLSVVTVNPVLVGSEAFGLTQVFLVMSAISITGLIIQLSPLKLKLKNSLSAGLLSMSLQYSVVGLFKAFTVYQWTLSGEGSIIYTLILGSTVALGTYTLAPDILKHGYSGLKLGQKLDALIFLKSAAYKLLGKHLLYQIEIFESIMGEILMPKDNILSKFMSRIIEWIKKNQQIETQSTILDPTDPIYISDEEFNQIRSKNKQFPDSTAASFSFKNNPYINIGQVFNIRFEDTKSKIKLRIQSYLAKKSDTGVFITLEALAFKCLKNTFIKNFNESVIDLLENKNGKSISERTDLFINLLSHAYYDASKHLLMTPETFIDDCLDN